jgi:hypothetical protein
MTEAEIRAIVREIVSRSSHGGAPDPQAPMPQAPHASHYKYNLAPADDRCVIEPGVPCNHCGYCLSHGH